MIMLLVRVLLVRLPLVRMFMMPRMTLHIVIVLRVVWCVRFHADILMSIGFLVVQGRGRIGISLLRRLPPVPKPRAARGGPQFSCQRNVRGAVSPARKIRNSTLAGRGTIGLNFKMPSR